MPDDGDWSMTLATRRVALQTFAAATVVSTFAPSGWTQSTYPARAVRVIVPFPPGGGTDIFSRFIAQKLTERLGQSFFVENIAGAGGNLGTGQAAKAAADGYTILFAFSSFAVNPSLYAKVPYDPLKDFQPVTLAVSTPTVVIVHPSIPANTLQELVEVVRKSPGKFTYASGGFGTQAHLVGEQIRLAYDIDLAHVPFHGAGPSVASVVAGHTPIGLTSLAAGIEQIKGGQVRALAVTSPRRAAELADVPTMAEVGQPSIIGDSWVGVLVPAATPKAVVTILHREIEAVMALPDTRIRLAQLGYEPIMSTSDAFARGIRSETETWAKVIAASNIKVQ
ncbi:MAG: tripartite tricarboxylate transporter substrate binding protein [Hyphomicrobiales bacterium]|nr:MAG: tripartite tricarboxylate transporter substrate binding protein [Hyphomicrobiales bacterium]